MMFDLTNVWNLVLAAIVAIAAWFAAPNAALTGSAWLTALTDWFVGLFPG